MDPCYYRMKNVQAFQKSRENYRAFTSELKSNHIGYLYQLMSDFKQCDIVDPPYLNKQISDSSDLEEDVQSPQNLLED